MEEGYCNYVLYDQENNVYVAHMSRNVGYASDITQRYQIWFDESLQRAQLWDNENTARRRCNDLIDSSIDACIIPVRIVRDEHPHDDGDDRIWPFT